MNTDLVNCSYLKIASVNIGSHSRCEKQSDVRNIYPGLLTAFWPLYGCKGMLGNQHKMVEKSKVCVRIQSHLILANWLYLSLSPWKMQLMSIKKLHTKSGAHSSPLLLFRKPVFFHTFLVIRQDKNYRKCMEESSFLNSDKGLLYTPHLVYSFFKFISLSLQRESDKYIQLGRICWHWIP